VSSGGVDRDDKVKTSHDRSNVFKTQLTRRLGQREVFDREHALRGTEFL
jgi:hypothetical protein